MTSARPTADAKTLIHAWRVIVGYGVADADHEAYRTGPDGVFDYSPFVAAYNA